jgi:hypothetical protein
VGWWFFLAHLGLHVGRHGGVELAEALAQPALRRHHLGDAPAHAAALAARQRLGREVVDARREARVDEVAECLRGEEGGKSVSKSRSARVSVGGFEMGRGKETV